MAARTRKSPAKLSLLDEPGHSGSSLLDVVDNVLNHGVVLQGELVLGVANVDLIYARLSLLLSAVDKVRERQSTPRSRTTPSRRRK